MREKVRIAVTVIIVLMILVGAIAIAIQFLFPAPDHRFDGIPTIYPYANDNAGALSPGYVDWLDDLCYQVDSETSCEIAILVVNTTQPNDINYFALRTFQKNQIGKEGKDNGVLIVVATEDQAWRVEVGYGLMGILTGARVTNLVDAYFVHYIESGDLDSGLVELTVAIGNIIIDEYTGDTSGTPAYPVSWIPLTWRGWLIVIVVVVVLSLVTRGRIFLPVIWILGGMARGGGKFGGGRSGGGGGRGGW
jgi:uncharacterized protein